MLNSINSLVNFVQIWQKVISLVTMATNVGSKLFTIVFLFLSGTDHSVKVLSNSESVRAGALLEFFGGYRELMLKSKDKFLITNVSNQFEKHSGRDSSSYIQQTEQATWVSRRTVFRVRKKLRETGMLSSPQRPKQGQYKLVDNFDEVVIRNNVQEFYTHRHQLLTINNLLSVLKLTSCQLSIKK